MGIYGFYIQPSIPMFCKELLIVMEQIRNKDWIKFDKNSNEMPDKL